MLGGLVAVGCGVRGKPRTDAAARAVNWLCSQQQPDGAFRSETYGFFSEGHALTGLVHAALSAADDAELAASAQARGKAAGFLAGIAEAKGVVGLTLVPEYPTYATALAVVALTQHPDLARHCGPLVAWMLGQQLTGTAWGEHPSRGAFPMGAATARTAPHAGHVDLSMTRHALMALGAHGLPSEHPAWAEAHAFVRRCATKDGGYRYAPGEPGANKGATDDAGYGTPTADAVLALRAIGAPAAEIDAAVAFLAPHAAATDNPGVGGAYAGYGPAMRFYWRATAAEALRGTARFREGLASEQHADGRWQNALSAQKEDDPLIATALGLLAWCKSR